MPKTLIVPLPIAPCRPVGWPLALTRTRMPVWLDALAARRASSSALSSAVNGADAATAGLGEADGAETVTLAMGYLPGRLRSSESAATERQCSTAVFEPRGSTFWPPGAVLRWHRVRAPDVLRWPRGSCPS